MSKQWSTHYKNKLIPPDQLSTTVARLRNDGKKIATINGSFDLLHAGHLEILFQASQVSDILIVALNSDSSIQKYKSPLRPIVSLESRLKLIAALEFIDFVTWFDETDPCNLLEIIKPDVHVNGSEYGHNCIEAHTVKSNGGRVHIVDLVPGLSTSQIIKKIISSQE